MCFHNVVFKTGSEKKPNLLLVLVGSKCTHTATAAECCPLTEQKTQVDLLVSNMW